jgi:hypothetical protein
MMATGRSTRASLGAPYRSASRRTFATSRENRADPFHSILFSMMITLLVINNPER